jgi:ubiquinone/menaquinone biosynthesis C-methylase UbiE
MRQLAPGYVGDARFVTSGFAAFDGLLAHGLQADGAFAIWSLQHSPNIEEDIRRIDRVLKPGAGLFVCNLYKAVVPTDQGWVDLGFDARALLAEAFDTVEIAPVAADHTTVGIADRSFIGCYRKRG